MAADISPVDVLSHIPVQCEQRDIPYIFVRSRMELGIAAETKKPTSVVLMMEPEEKKYKKKYEAMLAKLSQ